LQANASHYNTTSDGAKESSEGITSATSFLEVHGTLTFRGKLFSELSEEEHELVAGLALEDLGREMGLHTEPAAMLISMGFLLLKIAAVLFILSYLCKMLGYTKLSAILAVGGIFCVVAAAACFVSAIGTVWGAMSHAATHATIWTLGPTLQTIGLGIGPLIMAGFGMSVAVVVGVSQFSGTLEYVNKLRPQVALQEPQTQRDKRLELLEAQLQGLTVKVMDMDANVRCNTKRINTAVLSIEQLSHKVEELETDLSNQEAEEQSQLKDERLARQADEDELRLLTRMVEVMAEKNGVEASIHEERQKNEEAQEAPTTHHNRGEP